MERIAIFGGTFNPVHDEHVATAVAAVKELKLDKIFITPAFLPPHKNVSPAKPTDRINMLKIAFRALPQAEISDFELLNGGKSYSYVTAEHFRAKYKDAEIFMIVGGDMLKDFKTWKYPDRILSAVKLAVVLREGYFTDVEKERGYFQEVFGKDFVTLDYVGKAVSSTAIRIRLAFGLKPQGISGEVSEYIRDFAVYPPDVYERYIIGHLPEKRVVHTANVVILAMKKAKELGLDYEKVRVAATLHDCAKYDDYKKYDGFILPEDVPQPVVHAFLGAFVAEKVLGVTDAEVLDAIRYHTSGKAEMSTLGKLIFVADMLEEGRNYEGVDILRKEFDADFESCFRLCIKEETLHLLNKKQYVYAETVNAYDYYINGKRS